MTLTLGIVAPVALVTLSLTVSWWFAVALILYTAVIFSSETVRRLGRAGGLVPTCTGKRVVLGGGWSWILRRRIRPPNSIVCRRGRCSTQGWWHSGTTIREVQETLSREEGRTLAGHPSILSATLGGWIGSRSHGTGGSLWTPTMGRIVVEDVANDSARRTLPSKGHVNIDSMVVREVELLSVPNVVCERRVSYLVSERDVSKHLFEAHTHLRAIFVDKFQSLCITWVPTQDQTVQSGVDFPPLWLMTALPASARRGLNADGWTRRMTLRDASAFGPEPSFLIATAAIATHTNFEVFVTESSTPHLIWRICSAFQTLFDQTSLRGRMELRFGRSVQFIDVDILRWSGNTDAVFETLYDIYGPNVRFTLHPGKAQVPVPPNLFHGIHGNAR